MAPGPIRNDEMLALSIPLATTIFDSFCRSSSSSGNSSRPSSVEDPKEYDNVGFSSYSKQNVYSAGPIVEDPQSARPNLGSFGKYEDNTAFEKDASSTQLW